MRSLRLRHGFRRTAETKRARIVTDGIHDARDNDLSIRCVGFGPWACIAWHEWHDRTPLEERHHEVGLAIGSRR